MAATASLWRQFKAMVIKNSLLKRRMWKTTVAEILTPVAFVTILCILRSLSTTIQDPNRMYVDQFRVQECKVYLSRFLGLPSGSIPELVYPCFDEDNPQAGNIHVEFSDNDPSRLHPTSVSIAMPIDTGSTYVLNPLHCRRQCRCLLVHGYHCNSSLQLVDAHLPWGYRSFSEDHAV
jgi:hypothetical protein